MMDNTKKILLIITLVIGALFIVKPVEAAIISVNPQDKEFAKGETFLAEIHLNSEQEVINAVEATITYPADFLEVVEISNGGSFLTLWVREPAYDQSAGRISFAGGIPGGSFVTDGKLLTITFKTKVAGAYEVDFDKLSTKVLLNDGIGTPASLKYISGIYLVTDSEFIEINSPSHPDENSWYQKKDLTVEWEHKKDANYSYILSGTPDEEPDNHRESTTGVVSFTDLTDGVYYFILKERISDGDWKLVGKRRAMIDTKPPLPIETVLTRDDYLYDGKYFLIFSTVDKISGIDRYDILDGDKLLSDVISPYVLEDQTQQSSLRVYAYDLAGNSTDVVVIGDGTEDVADFLDDLILSLPVILVVGLMALLMLWLVFKLRTNK